MYVLSHAVLSSSVVSDSLHTPWMWPARLLCPRGFSRQEYWSGLPCPSLGDLPNPEIKPRSSALRADSLPAEPPGKLLRIVAYFPVLCNLGCEFLFGGALPESLEP